VRAHLAAAMTSAERDSAAIAALFSRDARGGVAAGRLAVFT
jgi:hypothetical protein